MLPHKVYFLGLIFSLIFIKNAHGWRLFWKGRRSGGNLIPPHMNLTHNQLPPDQWFDQKLDHLDESNNAIWKQVSKLNEMKNSYQIYYVI